MRLRVVSVVLSAIVITLSAQPGSSQVRYGVPKPQTGIQVDVELVIAVDVSGSMSEREHQVQREGFLEAFLDKRLIDAITSGPRGQIAVTYIEWAGQFSQDVLVPWRLIKDRASAAAFVRALQGKPRTPIRGTSISGALAFSAKLFTDNGFSGLRRVIDVSADGPNRTGPQVDKVRDEVVRSGIVINGLPLMLSPMMQRATHGYGLDHYFTDCVIGGLGAFVFPVLKASALKEAIRRKLIIEVSGKTPRVVRVQNNARRRVNCQIGRSYRDDW